MVAGPKGAQPTIFGLPGNPVRESGWNFRQVVKDRRDGKSAV